MLNELVLRTIIVKFDIIFLELEDNRLIELACCFNKSLTSSNCIWSIWLVLLKQRDF